LYISRDLLLQLAHLRHNDIRLLVLDLIMLDLLGISQTPEPHSTQRLSKM